MLNSRNLMMAQRNSSHEDVGVIENVTVSTLINEAVSVLKQTTLLQTHADVTMKLQQTTRQQYSLLSFV